MSGALVLAVVATGLTLPVSSAAATGSDLYVDGSNASCSDGGSGSAAQPYCTAQAAADAAQAGDTVHVTAGSYGALRLTRSGDDGAPIRFTGQYTGSVRFDSLTVSGVHDVSLDRMFLGAVRIDSSSTVALDFDTLNGGTTPGLVVGAGSSKVTVSRSSVQANGVSAAEVDPGAQGVVITTDMIETNGGTPGVAVHGATGTDVVSDAFMGSAVPVQVDQSASGTVLENDDVEGPITVSADSAATTTSDYNVDYTVGSGPLYSWAGVDYGSLSPFTAASGQGKHDLAGGPVTLVNGPGSSDRLELDSADAAAPGELTTDYFGRPRVDDTLVPNTGTGAGYYDRGATELQDPWQGWTPKAAPAAVAYGSTVSFTTGDANPWHDVVTRTFDFGDGTEPVTTTDTVVRHTYGAVPGGGSKVYTVTVTEVSPATGEAERFTTTEIVSPPGPVSVQSPQFAVQNTSVPLAVTLSSVQYLSPFSLGSCSVDFGDGTTLPGCGNLTHTYAKPGIYQTKVAVTDAAGRSASVGRALSVGPEFVRTTPVTALDTYHGTGGVKGAVAPGRTLRIQVANRYGVPGVPSSVVLNVSAVGAGQAGSVTAYADGSSRPSEPTVLYPARQSSSSLIHVPVGADGYVDLTNLSGQAYVSAEVEGYDTTNPESAHGLEFVGGDYPGDTQHWALVMQRRMGPGATVSFQAAPGYQSYMTPPGQRPLLAVLNVATQITTAFTRVTVQGGAGAGAGADGVYGYPGQMHSTTLLVPVAPDGTVSIHNTAGSTTVSASVEGYYLPASSDEALHALVPVRSTPVFDTRTGLGGRHAQVPYSGTLWIKVAGVGGIPAAATEVAVRLSAVDVRSGGIVDEDHSDGMVLDIANGQPAADLVDLPVVNGYIKVSCFLQSSFDLTASVEGYAVS
ncbi:PKD domain-containing protein [Streptacidiphilus anmyonensis]|uniref:PKD domain-containing protein n=1 Tax=Streptacidiphilus anmyonensis TaxID=405782 RepID=UPI0005AB20AA|nr:PKD domain-containing protein [Streptacidiphilus anmyonensis]